MANSRRNRPSRARRTGSNVRSSSRGSSARSGSQSRVQRHVDSNQISRNEFLKGISASALFAAAGITAVGIGGTVTAQAQTQSYTDEEIFKTLAAVADTIIPGILGVPIVIVDENFNPIPDPDNPPYLIMLNLGAAVEPGETATHGAVGYIPLGLPNESGLVPPAYPFLCLMLPQLSHEPNIIDLLIETVDSMIDPYKDIPSAENPPKFYSKFKELPYNDIPTNVPDPNNPGQNIVIPGRYTILYLMDKPDLLIPMLIPIILQGMGIPGCPPDCLPEVVEQAEQIALEKASGAKQLITITIYATYFIYLSELCNVVPKPVTDPETGEVTGYEYRRNDDNTWTIIPDGIWHQMEYPGPSYKEPSYASTYDGLRVTIADGKVKIQ